MVYLGSGSGAAAVKIGLAYGWSIDVTRETAESNALGDNWKTFLTGMLGYKFHVDGRLDNTDVNEWLAATGITSGSAGVANWYIYPDATQATHYYYGQAWPSISITATLKDVINYKLSGDGYGQIAYN